jgi:hypothetical protein
VRLKLKTARSIGSRGRGTAGKLADVDIDVWERPLEQISLETVMKCACGRDGNNVQFSHYAGNVKGAMTRQVRVTCFPGVILLDCSLSIFYVNSIGPSVLFENRMKAQIE